MKDGTETVCRHCDRTIRVVNGRWVHLGLRSGHGTAIPTFVTCAYRPTKAAPAR